MSGETTPQGPTAAFETWTPQEAEKVLGTNEVNRPQRKGRLALYTRNMKRGTFDTVSPIVIDDSGGLIDGQHRLTAQVKAGVPMTWLVVRNVPNHYQRNMDTGAARNFSDQLSFEGETNVKHLAPLANAVYRIENNSYSTRTFTASFEELHETFERHPEMKISASFAHAATTPTFGAVIRLPPSVVAAAHWLIMDKNDAEIASEFMTMLLTMTNVPEASAIRAGVSRFRRMNESRERVHKVHQLALVIKIWNAFVRGETPSKLYVRSVDKNGEFLLPKVLKYGVKPEEQEPEEEVIEADAEG